MHDLNLRVKESNSIINDLKEEKNKLIEEYDTHIKNEVYITSLEKDIANYKDISNAYLKNCPILAEQLITLRKELEKYSKAEIENSKDKTKGIEKEKASKLGMSKVMEIEKLTKVEKEKDKELNIDDEHLVINKYKKNIKKKEEQDININKTSAKDVKEEQLDNNVNKYKRVKSTSKTNLKKVEP